MASIAAENRLEQYFDDVQSVFDQAAQRTGAITRDHRIGDRCVRLRFAGSALAERMLPAFAHLASTTGAAPDVSLCLWDCASTGTQLPAADWLPQSDGAGKEMYVHHSPALHMTVVGALRELNLYSPRRRSALYCVPDVSAIPCHEFGVPVRRLLHWWAAQEGRCLVHAGAVGTATGGVLLAGRGGSGKSTTALACAAAGMSYVADDMCLLSSQPKPYIHSVYNSGKLTSTSLQLLPQLARDLNAPPVHEDDKALFFLQQHMPEKVCAGFPVRAVLLPNVTTNRTTALRPASSAEALKQLAPSTLFLLSGVDRTALGNMAELVRRVPCYYLDLGRDFEQIPEVIRSLIHARAVLDGCVLADDRRSRGLLRAAHSGAS